MAFRDDLEKILTESDGEAVSSAIANCIDDLVDGKYQGVDVTDEVTDIRSTPYGRLLKQAVYDALFKLSQEETFTKNYIVELSESEYNDLKTRQEVLYGIKESDVAYAVLLDSNHNPTIYTETIDTVRGIQTFLMNHQGESYHISVGSDMDEQYFRDSLFSNESALYSIDVPEGFTSISDTCFYGSSLTEITLPQSITTIEDGAFGNCDNLKYIRIGKNITSIGENAFYGCDSITIEIEVDPDSVSGSPWGATNATVKWICL